ncbi:MAG: hypothetical protein F6K41_21215 [Symploca sp. SIO3E6]|nr:hypothetical protein [Caldora sp. SIO3E6]
MQQIFQLLGYPIRKKGRRLQGRRRKKVWGVWGVWGAEEAEGAEEAGNDKQQMTNNK